MLKLLKKIVPGTLKKRVSLQMEKAREAVDRKIPRYELSRKHIANLKAVEDRNALLELLPKNSTVAEIGVDHGDFSEHILRIVQPAKLHLVDIWDSERYHRGLMDHVQKKFAKEIEGKQVEINLGLSVEVGPRFPDHYFDWVYIDTVHSYQVTRDELEIYSHKVKPGGIMAGHDFIVGNWIKQYRYGVIEAVYEFCVKNDWELIYLSLENKIPGSFAIRKIS